MFKELVNSQGWEQLAEFAEAQLINRRLMRESPAQGFDGLIHDEFLKGEISGIALFMRFPEIIEEDFTSQLDELKEVLENG